ncbi:MAG: recombinase family protein, partial [Desulfobacteraceae bacterium]|nr:recombinase family protein [Desulfobacteraceae bacterium]
LFQNQNSKRSGLSQIEGQGLDRQSEAIRSYAEANKYEILKVFREEGISGTLNEQDRPAFKEMISEILRNGANTIIIESLDRLAREYRIQEQLLIYLVSKGIDLISANTGENVTQAIQDDPMKKAMVQIQGIFSELDKSLLVRKLRKAREKVRDEKGKCEGRKHYGEDSAHEQEVVRRIKLMRRNRKGGLKGMTLQAIADKLNEEGIRTKTGKKWQRVQVMNVLKT